MSNKIVTHIECTNLAPLTRLKAEIKTDSLRIAVFANNGSGKTFLSRVIRLIERNAEPPKLLQSGKASTDKLITFGETSSSFTFKVTDKENTVQEQFTIGMKRGYIPTIPQTRYIFHCFNQDYVEENIHTLSYDKDNNITGFILGKANIDVSVEQERLDKEREAHKILQEKVDNSISALVKNKIGGIPNIIRLSEYAYLNYAGIKKDINDPWTDVNKTFDEYLADYNKIKAIPENLVDISALAIPPFDLGLLTTIEDSLRKEYSLGAFSEDFKEKVKAKQPFIETGVSILKEGQPCPFCEQELNEAALKLIDEYTRFLQDEEAKAIKHLTGLKMKIGNLFTSFEHLEAENDKRIISYDGYTSKYIPSLESTQLQAMDSSMIKGSIDQVVNALDLKIQNISEPLVLAPDVLDSVEEFISVVNELLQSNNGKIKTLNAKKNAAGEENKAVRRNLCKVVFNELAELHKEDFNTMEVQENTIRALEADIRQKKEQERVDKKVRVAGTVKAVLKEFFGEKYALDEQTFRLTLNAKILEEGQAKEVLSEGEKNVIAFAYFLGDTHLKIETEAEYSKLFFVIDDPISSMDFNHVYSVSGILRNLKKITNDDRARFLVLTHNIEFMRVLVNNGIATHGLILKDGEIKDFNHTLTIPYVSHLHDIYRISQGVSLPNHTTANSIRHIIETLTKFESIHANESTISKYIADNFPEENKTYTLINDLSHGGWRAEQSPINEEDMVEICKDIVVHIQSKYKGQIEYCSTMSS